MGAFVGLSCFRVPSFLKSVDSKEKEKRVGKLITVYESSKENRHPDFERLIKSMPDGTMMSNHTMSEKYAKIVNSRMQTIKDNYSSYMDAHASILYRILRKLGLIRENSKHVEINDFWQVKSNSTENTENIMVPYSWVMRYGMPPWNEGTGKNDPQLIAHLREFNNIFFQNGKVKLEKEVAGSGKKITYARVTSPIHVTDQLLYSLAIQGYPIKYVDSTSYLFNPDSGQPISQKLSKQADRLKQILQKFYVKKDGQANDDFVKNFNKKFQSPLIDGELCNMRWIILF